MSATCYSAIGGPLGATRKTPGSGLLPALLTAGTIMFGAQAASAEPFVANTSSGASAPKIVSMSDGNLLIAYAVPDEDAFLIKGQLFDPLGFPVGDEFTFDFQDDRFSGPIDDEDFVIAALPNGRVAGATEQAGSNRLEMVSGIFAVDETGAAFLDGRIHLESGNATLFNPTVASLDEDSYRIYYVNRKQGNRQVEESGLQDGEFVATSDVKNFDGDDNAELDSDTLKNGNIVLILDRDGKGERGLIHFRVLRPNGSTVKSGETGDGNDETFDSTVAALKSGRFVVAWAKDNGQETDIRFAVFTAAGNPVKGPTTTASTGNADDNNEPAIAALDDGGFIIFYDKDAGAPQVRGQRFDRNGRKVGGTFLVTDDNGARLDAALLQDGRAVVAYELGGDAKVAIVDVDRTTILGTNGKDTINGSTADELILGGKGNDKLRGRAGDDRLDGGPGKDRVFGDDGDDILIGGPRRDRLKGGTGSDIFIVRDGDGRNTILDFDANDDDEVIDVSALTAIDNVGDLLFVHASQVGKNVVIDDLEGTIIKLKKVDIGDLNFADFVF